MRESESCHVLTGQRLPYRSARHRPLHVGPVAVVAHRDRAPQDPHPRPPAPPGSGSARRPRSSGRQSPLTEIAPNKILIRGYPLDEMMGRLGFAEAVYLLLMGELATPAIGRMFEPVPVCVRDH